MPDVPDYNMTVRPGGHLTEDADISLLGPWCFDMDGAHWCKATALIAGIIPINGAGYVLIGLGAGPTRGFHMPYTPEGARIVAARILEAAEQIEAVQKEQANAQLAATLAKRDDAA